jgi:hypothetical protein
MYSEKPKKLTKDDTCPITKILRKIHLDKIDKSRVKLDEKDIFVSAGKQDANKGKKGAKGAKPKSKAKKTKKRLTFGARWREL